MHVRALKVILKSIAQSVKCPSCGTSFVDDGLTVVSAIDSRCIVVAQCASCNTAILITAVVQEMPAGSTTPTEIRHMDQTRVSHDDVESIHDLLKDFKGDLSRLLDGAEGGKGMPGLPKKE